MTRRLWVPFAVAIAVALTLLASASAVQPGPAIIQVTAQLDSTRTGNGHLVRNYRLYNAPAYKNSIGTASLVCERAGTRWLCHEFIELQRGQIAAAGLVTNLNNYHLAVTGGTGFYSNVGGHMHARPLGDNYLVDITLAAF